MPEPIRNWWRKRTYEMAVKISLPKALFHAEVQTTGMSLKRFTSLRPLLRWCVAIREAARRWGWLKYPGVSQVRGGSERIRANGSTKRTREKDEKAATKWEGIRQKKGSAGDGEKRSGNGAGDCTPLPQKRYPLMHGTFNSILRRGGRREVILSSSHLYVTYAHAHAHGNHAVRSCESYSRQHNHLF